MDKKIGEFKGLVVDHPFETFYMNYAGAICSKFLTELRDNKRIMGIKCPQCNRVLVPARPTCARCFAQTEGWVAVSDRGKLITHTTALQTLPCHPGPPPITYGVIQLEGADTGLVHLLGEVKLKDISIGMGLQAVFNNERKGDIRDIKYFRPVR
jgi:uncharacterized OB-fold protein